MTKLSRLAQGWGLLTAFVLAPVMLAEAKDVAFMPPCASAHGTGASNGWSTIPVFGPVDGQPVLAREHDALLELPSSCFSGASTGASADGSAMVADRFDLVFALAGRFTFEADVETLAARIGSISSLRALRYWSVTDDEWRLLNNDISAVSDAVGLEPRTDFTAAEVLSGDPLYFHQDDTRSSGYNLFAMRSVDRSSDRLVVEGINVSPIRFLFLTIFEPRGLRTLHFFQRLSGKEWGYYGLSVIRPAGFVNPERSLINRAAAYYRFLVGQASDDGPPLAP